MKYRKLTQEWFMPKNLGRLETDIRVLAKSPLTGLLPAAVRAIL